MPDLRENLAARYDFNSGTPSMDVSNEASTAFWSSFFSCGRAFLSYSLSGERKSKIQFNNTKKSSIFKWG